MTLQGRGGSRRRTAVHVAGNTSPLSYRAMGRPAPSDDSRFRWVSLEGRPQTQPQAIGGDTLSLTYKPRYVGMWVEVECWAARVTLFQTLTSKHSSKQALQASTSSTAQDYCDESDSAALKIRQDSSVPPVPPAAPDRPGARPR